MEIKWEKTQLQRSTKQFSINRTVNLPLNNVWKSIFKFSGYLF